MPRIPISPAWLVVLGFASIGGPASGQADAPLRVEGLGPGGLRSSVTERWGEISFTLRNVTDTPRLARIVAFHDGGEETEFARDLWVPAHTAVTAWMSVGPVPKLGPGGKPFSSIGRTLHYILFDRTDGTSKLIRPNTDEKRRDRAVFYRPNSERSTTLIADRAPEPPDLSSFAQPTADLEAAELVRVMRGLGKQSEYLSVVHDGSLPATPESFDGTDEIVLACNQLKNEPHSRAALRQWVERGGHLWVMLERVDADLLGSLLGEECAPQVVDRTSLSAVRFQRPSASDKREPIAAAFGVRDFERPVEFVRVALTGHETVHHYVDSWPASFSIRVGRGRILVTTLGPRGWTRPRGFAPATGGPGRPRNAVADPPSPFQSHPSMPVALDQLLELHADLKSSDSAFTVDDLRPVLLDEIGYSVPGRGAVAAVLGAFVAALAGLAWLVRRSRRTEIVGWLAPASALVVAGGFYFFGATSRHAIPPTAAVAELAEAIPGSGEIVRIGAFAAYQPSAGELRLASSGGGVLDFDFEGLDGQSRTRVQTDRDAWHYEKLSLPAGVRQGQYRATIAGAASAIASFGPDGVRGRLAVEGFRDAADAILVARGRDTSGVRLAADGSFSVGRDEMLPPGDYLAGAVLSDRQQRHQAIYRKMIGGSLPDHYDDRDFLMAWTTPESLPFQANEGSRSIGSSLVTVPVEYVRPAAGTKVFVPRSYLPYRRWLEGRPRVPTFESTRPIEMRLRFQLPDSVVPMTVEKAVLIAKVRAPSRRVTVSGYAGETAEKIVEVETPTEPIRVEISDPRQLRLDGNGGFFVGIAFSGNPTQERSPLESFWTIESIHLELEGRTVEKK